MADLESWEEQAAKRALTFTSEDLAEVQHAIADAEQQRLHARREQERQHHAQQPAAEPPSV